MHPPPGSLRYMTIEAVERAAHPLVSLRGRAQLSRFPSPHAKRGGEGSGVGGLSLFNKFACSHAPPTRLASVYDNRSSGKGCTPSRLAERTCAALSVPLPPREAWWGGVRGGGAFFV